MKPYSPEWYARERAWIAKCQAGYEAAANELVAQGYARRDHEDEPRPATFHGNNKVLVLARKLGSSEWDAKIR